MSGNFTTLAGQPRSYIGRLNSDGTLDITFNPWANGGVGSLAVQADGKILVGGAFTMLAGQVRTNIGRLIATWPATQSLGYDGSTLTWLRGGSSPEIWRTSFEFSTNLTTWSVLGSGERINGGWSLGGLSLLPSGQIRARGYVTGGLYNSSTWFLEQTLTVDPNAPPQILVGGGFGFSGSQFGFKVRGLIGQVMVVEASTNLLHWFPLATNIFSTNTLCFADSENSPVSSRFYRARLR